MKKLLLSLFIIALLLFSSCSTETIENFSYNKNNGILKVSGAGELSGEAVYSVIPKGKKLIHLEVGKGFTSVAKDGFNAETDKRNKNIQTVEFSDTMKIIGDSAFKSCNKLRDIKFPGNLQKIGKSAFEKCKNYYSLTFPENLNKIGARAFAGNKIENFKLGKNTKIIDKEAFIDCGLLKYIKLNNSLREIGGSAFKNCSKLIVVNIPRNAKIGDKAFYNCKKLQGVLIPKNVKNIGEKAFGYYTVKGVEKKIKDFIVKGDKNSAAFIYAKENGFKFIENKIADFKLDLNAKEIAYKQLPSFGYVDAFYTLTNKLWEYNDIDKDENYDLISDSFYDNLFEDNHSDYEDGTDVEKINYKEYKGFLKADSLDAGKYSVKITKKIISKYRKCGDYIISDFKDGVCINRYLYNKKRFKKYKKGKKYPYTVTINIPEKLGGKKVLKLGEYLEKATSEFGDETNEYGEDEYVPNGFLTTIPDGFYITLKIPATVTDITSSALESIDEYKDDFFYSNGYITDIEVNADNPLYTSENGVMYSKDKKWLLFFRPDDYDELKGGKRQVFTVPESVEYIADTNLCETQIDPDYTLVLGNNIKKIYGDIRTGECGTYSCTFKPAKGSYAEKWVKRQTSYNS